jgi:drug/metabolite transporter (DMT)-like permease
MSPTLPAVNPSFDLAGHSDKSAGMESRAAPTGRAEAARAEPGRADAAATQVPARRGPSTHAFAKTDWALLAGVAAMWGSSFLFIDVGLESLHPAAVTLLRLLFGAATLAIFPKARSPVPSSEWGLIALLGLVWMAIPLLLFPIAQQWIDSSLAGMINGAVPLFAAAVAALILRRLPGGRQMVGLAIGFVGVVAIGWPADQNARATALGIALVLLASVLYGVALNIAAPLQQRHGALPVLFRAQLCALAVVAVPGAVGLSSSSFAAAGVIAVAALGCLGTALAFVAMSTLVGRVGVARGSVTIYFIPIVAILLGVILRDETVALISLAGTALVMAGAYLTSRREVTPQTRA